MFSFMSRLPVSALAGIVPAAAVFLTPLSVQAASPRPSVIVFNQPVKDNSIDITYANLPKDGFLVVLGSTGDGMPGRQPMGVIDLKAGDHRDVKVKLTQAAKPGQRLWVSLYGDTDGKPGFNAAADKPLITGALPAQNAFLVK